MYPKYASVLTFLCMYLCVPQCPCVFMHPSARTHVCTVSACPSPSLEQILKLCPKKKSSSTYTFCKSVGLLGMQFHLFENECKSPSDPDMWQRQFGGNVAGWRDGRGDKNRQGPGHSPQRAASSLTRCCSRPRGPGVCFPDYSHGITLVTPLSGSEKKQVLHFCALGSDEMQKFVEDLKESIAEVTELEQIRRECKAAVCRTAGAGRGCSPAAGSGGGGCLWRESNSLPHSGVSGG